MKAKIIIILLFSLVYYIEPLPVRQSTTPDPCEGSSSALDDSGILEDIDDSDTELVEAEDPSEGILQNARQILFNAELTRDAARALLKRALELLDDPNPKDRGCPEDEAAKKLIEFITGVEYYNEARLRSVDDARDEDYCPSDDEPEFDGVFKGKKWSLETMKKILQYHEQGMSEKSIKGKYKQYYRQLLPIFRRCVERRTSWRHRQEDVNAFTLQRFREMRARNEPVHETDIEEWALQRAREIGHDNFVASRRWLHLFKKRNRIAARDRTKLVTQAEMDNRRLIEDRIANFHREFNERSQQYSPSHVINMDQVGFAKEPVDTRTLSFVGERDTLVRAHDRNKVTHSYTTQPLITRDGKLLGPLLICLQETGGPHRNATADERERGSFGIKIVKHICDLENQYRNIRVVASTSGKMSRELTDYWVREVMIPAVRHIPRMDRSNESMVEETNTSSLLLLDSWSGQQNELVQSRLREAGISVLRIPEKTTDQLQPLDVYFNRQYKKFWKRIVRIAKRNDLGANVTSRDGILNMQSLMYDQMSSLEYEDMLRYAWHKTDPVFDRSEMAHETPDALMDVNFKFDRRSICEVEGCQHNAFIRCSHCGKKLCIKHFLDRVCFHSDHRWGEEEQGDDFVQPFCRQFDASSSTTTEPTGGADANRDIPAQSSSSQGNAASHASTVPQQSQGEPSTAGGLVSNAMKAVELSAVGGVAGAALGAIGQAVEVASAAKTAEAAVQSGIALQSLAGASSVGATSAAGSGAVATSDTAAESAGILAGLPELKTEDELRHLLGKGSMNYDQFKKVYDAIKSSGKFRDLFKEKVL